MIMPAESLDCEGVVDVGLLIVAHFPNPAQEEALQFLRKVLLREIRAVIPLSAFLGAYHIMTRYLNLQPPDIISELSHTLSVSPAALYEHIRQEDVIQALLYASSWRIQSWDGFVLALAARLGTRTVFSIDRELHRRAPDFTVVCPLKEETLQAYHQFLKELEK